LSNVIKLIFESILNLIAYLRGRLQVVTAYLVFLMMPVYVRVRTLMFWKCRLRQ